MKPYLIIQNRYDPPCWNTKIVGEELCAITKSFGLIPLQDPNHKHQTKASWYDIPRCAYVRRRTVSNPKAASWHQDGDLTDGILDSSIVLWTSNTPTELKGLDDTMYHLPNRAVVLIRNNLSYHRRPPNAPLVRWLFRQRVENP